MKTATILVALYDCANYLESKIANLKSLSNFADCDIYFLNCLNLGGESGIIEEFVADNDNVKEIMFDEYVSLYHSWNVGIKESHSKYVLNSNVDDLLHPDYVKVCCDFLDNADNFDIVSSGVLVTDIPCQVYPNWKYHSKMPYYPYPLSSAGPCPVWRRSLHDRYGYFDGRCLSIGDAVMWEKWLENGVKFAFIEEDLVLYYMNPNSLERRSVDGVSLRDIDLKAIGRQS